MPSEPQAVWYVSTLPSITTDTQLALSKAVKERHSSWCDDIAPFDIASLTALGKWDELEAYNDDSLEHNFHSQLSMITLSTQKTPSMTMEQLKRETNQMKLKIIPSIVSLCESYSMSYDSVVKLHMISEFEHLFKLSLLRSNGQNNLAMKDHIGDFDGRLNITSSSFHIREPIQAMRRSILTIFRDVTKYAPSSYLISSNECEKDMYNLAITRSLIQTSKLCRALGFFDSSHSAILSASCFKSFEVTVEKAEYMWDTGDTVQAYTYLQAELDGLQLPLNNQVQDIKRQFGAVKIAKVQQLSND